MVRELNRILTAKEKREAAMIAGFDLLMALLDIGFLAILMLLVARYSAPDQQAASTGIPALLSEITPLSFVILFLLKNLAAYAGTAHTYRYFARVSTRLSSDQLRRYFAGPVEHFTGTDASVFVRRISQQPVEFSTYILANLQAIVSQTLLAAFAITAILFYHPSLFLILFVLLLPPLFALGWLLRRRLKGVRQEIKRTGEKAIQFLQESLGGYVEAKIYRRHDFFTRRFVSRQAALNGHIARQQTLQNLPSRLLETVVVAGFFLLVTIRSRLGAGANTDWLTLGVFLGASWKIIPALVRIMNSSGQVKTYSFILKDLVPAEGTVAGAAGKIPGQQKAPVRFVSVEELQFRYAPGKPQLSTHFHLKRGDLAALTGRSGSGKSTLLQLMAGLLQPDKGNIRIEYASEPSGAVSTNEQQIVYVKQQPFLLNDTLQKNITLLDEGDDAGKAARVAHLCGLAPLIAGHALGLGQPVAENGRNISGGQRQRIMLARALYHSPQLLLLDEPFSELDEPAEMELMQLLAGLASGGMTILIATHNSSAAACCDLLISLDEPVYA